MVIIANDHRVELPEGSTVADLLGALSLDRKWVIVERNGEAVARRAVGETRLSDGDRVELVRAVAGG